MTDSESYALNVYLHSLRKQFIPENFQDPKRSINLLSIRGAFIYGGGIASDVIRSKTWADRSPIASKPWKMYPTLSRWHRRYSRPRARAYKKFGSIISFAHPVRFARGSTSACRPLGWMIRISARAKNISSRSTKSHSNCAIIPISHPTRNCRLPATSCSRNSSVSNVIRWAKLRTYRISHPILKWRMNV